MRSIISRWFLFGLLIGWSVTHANVFGQPSEKSTDAKSPAAIDKLRQGLDKKITVDFTGQSIADVLNHIKDRSGLAITLDEQALLMMGMVPFDGGGVPNVGGVGNIQQFQVKATNEKTSTVLRKFLNTYRLSYVIFEDSILVTAEEMAVMRQMRQRVSVNVEAVPAKQAISDLARKHGINLVIDPKIDASAPVSLEVENTGIETALRLLAELASLKAVRMGNVMFVTSEEKAAKIRKEEPHQFDNPLNPNNPVQGGFGGGFGDIAMPFRAVPPVAVAPGLPQIDPAPPRDLPAKEAPRKAIDPDQPVAPPPPPTAPGRPGVERPPVQRPEEIRRP